MDASDVDAGAPRRRRDARRRGEQQSAHELGPACASRSATWPPNECPATSAALSLLGLEHVGGRGREVPDPGAAREPARPRMTRKVDGNHAEPLDQLRDQLDPVRSRAAEPVEEKERLAAAADVIAQRAEVARLEARCSRHLGDSILRSHGVFGGAGPLIPANNERAMS